jgi:hypothetical protein
MKKPFKDTGVGKFLREKVAPIAGDVLQIVGDITGRESIEKIGQLLNDRKEQSAEAMALHMEFEKYKLEWEMELQRLELEIFKTELADRESARAREIQYMQANGGKRDWLMGSVVAVALTMYVCAFAFLAYGPVVPDGKKDLFNMGVGQVFTFVGMVFAYYLGTTKSSRTKDETIASAIK